MGKWGMRLKALRGTSTVDSSRQEKTGRITRLLERIQLTASLDNPHSPADGESTSTSTTTGKVGAKDPLGRVSFAMKLPDELWVQIAASALQHSETAHIQFPTTLQNLSCVSWQVRSAITQDPTLWSDLPPIAISPEFVPRIGRMVEILHLYLSRAASLPLTITLRVAPAWKENQAAVSQLVGYLAEYSHRWKTLRLFVSIPALELISAAVRDRLPTLRSLYLKVAGVWDLWRDPRDIGCFKTAPNLRYVEILGPFHLQIPIPTQQLKRLKFASKCTAHYYDVILSKAPQLQFLLYHEQDSSRRTYAVPPQTILPALTQLRIEGQSPQSVYCDTYTSRRHLAPLVLPSLTDLELRGWDQTDNVYETVLELIQRSQCSVQRLVLLDSGRRPNTRPDTTVHSELFSACIRSLFTSCGLVTHLELNWALQIAFTHIFPEHLSLIKSPPLPALRTLVLHIDQPWWEDMDEATWRGIEHWDTPMPSFLNKFLSKTMAIEGLLLPHGEDGSACGWSTLATVDIRMSAVYRRVRIDLILIVVRQYWRDNHTSTDMPVNSDDKNPVNALNSALNAISSRYNLSDDGCTLSWAGASTKSPQKQLKLEHQRQE